MFRISPMFNTSTIKIAGSAALCVISLAFSQVCHAQYGGGGSGYGGGGSGGGTYVPPPPPTITIDLRGCSAKVMVGSGYGGYGGGGSRLELALAGVVTNHHNGCCAIADTSVYETDPQVVVWYLGITENHVGDSTSATYRATGNRYNVATAPGDGIKIWARVEGPGGDSSVKYTANENVVVK